MKNRPKLKIVREQVFPKDAKERPKVILEFEPDKNFQEEFSQWIFQLLEDVPIKKGKRRRDSKIRIP